VFLASFGLIAGTSESTRAKTAETFLELLGARVRNPNTRSAYRVAWSSFLAFHSFRATGVTKYMNSGGTIEIAQRIAGHTDPLPWSKLCHDTQPNARCR